MKILNSLRHLILSLGTSTVHAIAIVCFLSLIKNVDHGGMPHATAVVMPSSARRPLWATANGCQNCKIFKE
jgi:hypothetical protein